MTVVEALDRIMPVEDEEVSRAAQKSFEKRGMKFRTGCKVTKVAKGGKCVQVAIEAGVGQLVLTHHDPAHNDARLDEKLAIARRAAGRRLWVENGFDGMVIDLANVTGLAV